jgi:hypothetical protein
MNPIGQVSALKPVTLASEGQEYQRTSSGLLPVGNGGGNDWLTMLISKVNRGEIRDPTQAMQFLAPNKPFEKEELVGKEFKIDRTSSNDKSTISTSTAIIEKPPASVVKNFNDSMDNEPTLKTISSGDKSSRSYIHLHPNIITHTSRDNEISILHSQQYFEDYATKVLGVDFDPNDEEEKTRYSGQFKERLTEVKSLVQSSIEAHLGEEMRKVAIELKINHGDAKAAYSFTIQAILDDIFGENPRTLFVDDDELITRMTFLKFLDFNAIYLKTLNDMQNKFKYTVSGPENFLKKTLEAKKGTYYRRLQRELHNRRSSYLATKNQDKFPDGYNAGNHRYRIVEVKHKGRTFRVTARTLHSHPPPELRNRSLGNFISKDIKKDEFEEYLEDSDISVNAMSVQKVGDKTDPVRETRSNMAGINYKDEMLKSKKKTPAKRKVDQDNDDRIMSDCKSNDFLFSSYCFSTSL